MVLVSLGFRGLRVVEGLGIRAAEGLGLWVFRVQCPGFFRVWGFKALRDCKSLGVINPSNEKYGWSGFSKYQWQRLQKELQGKALPAAPKYA